MKRLLAVACTSLMFLAGGCDDDDDVNWRGDAAADGTTTTDTPPAGTDSGATMCTGTFAMYTRAQLTAVTTAPGGKCTSATDVGLLCTGGIGDKIREYGRGCLTQGAPDLTACIRTTATMNHKDLSMGCLECYIGSVTCTLSKCSGSCVPDPGTPACMQCQVTQGCISGFLTCAGVRLPTADAGTDGAATDTRPPDGGTDAGTTDGGTDAARDTAATEAGDSGTDATDAPTG